MRALGLAGLGLLLACGPREDHDPPVTASPETRALYLARCAGCHKHTYHPLPRKGGLHQGTPTFYGAAWMASRSDELLVATILSGRKGTIMPSFESLGPERAREIVQGILRPLSRRRPSGTEHFMLVKTRDGGTQCTEGCL